jgi:hypothetical protein
VGITGLAPIWPRRPGSSAARTTPGDVPGMGRRRTCSSARCAKLGGGGWAARSRCSGGADLGRAARAASGRRTTTSGRCAATASSGRRAAAAPRRCAAAAIVGIPGRRRAFIRSAGAVLEPACRTFVGCSPARRVSATGGRLGSAGRTGRAGLAAGAIVE